MSKIYGNVSELIGNTPIIKLNKLCREYDLCCDIMAKLEMFNPGGSIKDRIARKMIDDAEKSGKLKKGGTIIEPTSGNTGIGLALMAAAKGYNMILTMPDTMSIERRKLAAAFGARIVLTEGEKGMKGAIEKAEELAEEIPDSIIAGQFVNPSNIQAHIESTGPEIWEDTDGDVDILVAGVGTGGTVTGIGKYLKSKNPEIKVIAVEPATSAVLSGEKAGRHSIQGIGAGFIPEILDTEIYDEVIKIDNEEAYKFTKALPRLEGILVGISSGAAIAAAVTVAKRKENVGKRIVVICPDTGDRYLSTPVFE